VKETVVYIIPTATRDMVIGEKWLKCKREPDNESDGYMVTVRKDGITSRPFVMKNISNLQNNFCYTHFA